MGALPQQKPARFGRYILLDRINVGGMAEVFRGKTAGVEGFERLVALKRILPNVAADPDFVEMLVEEAKLAVQLQHANIAQIYDLGIENESHYIAMEYVSGVDLRMMWDRARNRDRLLPIAMSCHIMQRVCEGLDAAHRKKDDAGNDLRLVHRDVSPQNILVSYEGEVKVIDFGIARAANRVSKTVAGALKGKFGYMSPEQVRGVPLDNRSDIFACGVVLYELLVGDRLFLSRSDFSTLERVRNVEMVPPTQVNRDLSPHLERIVMKALAKRREDRYRWAGEMAEDLQRYLFATNQPFARSDLARYMQQHFEAEIQQEKQRLEHYKRITFDAHDGSVGDERSREAPPARPVPHEASPAVPVASAAPVASAVPVASAAPVPPGVLTPSAAPVASPPTGARARDLPRWAVALIGGLSVLLVGVVAAAVATIWGTPAPGALVVQATPAHADILVNGQLVANAAPFSLDNLQPGTYVVKLAAPGHRESVRAVKIGAGQSRLEVFDLEPRRRTAALTVRSEPPGLAVWIDGEDTGRTTPTTMRALDVGDRLVVLRQDSGAMVHRVEVRLEDGTTRELDVDTAGLPPLLDVRSIPSRAEVFVRGEPRGRTPVTIAGLEPGRARVKVVYPGCAAFSRRVRFKRATIRELDVKLVCRRSAKPVVPGEMGRLNVTASVVADVYVDGLKVGRTPGIGLAVPRGRRTVRLVPVAAPAQPYETELYIEDEPVVIDHRF